MSMTFWCPDAPRRRIPCEWCAYWAAEDPKMLTKDGRCDRSCKGTQEVSDSPEFTWSNSNARDVLRLLGLPPEDGGQIEVAQIPGLLQRLLSVSNQETTRNHLVTETVESQETRMAVVGGMPTIRTGARMIDVGNTDEQTLRRVQAVQALLSWAAEHGHPVCWG